MKVARGLTVTLGALLLLGLTGAMSSAAAQSAPQGSYLHTCTNVRLDGQTLRAHCRMNNGHDQLTELHEVDRCVGDIANNNGLLQCRYGQAPNPGYGQGLPQVPGGPGYGSERRDEGREDRERRERCAGLENREHELRERLERTGYSEERERLEYQLRETHEQLRDQCRR
jgi:hypothetical protein